MRLFKMFLVVVLLSFQSILFSQESLTAEFSPAWISIPALGFSSASFGDYNGDGYLDLAVSGQDSNKTVMTKVYRNNKNGSFTDINANLIPVITGSTVWGDYNNDGSLDLLITGCSSDYKSLYTRLYKNQGGEFIEVPAPFPALRSSKADWGDYNNDGLLDLVITGTNSSNYSYKGVFKNLGNDQFENVSSLPLSSFAGTVKWGDYDNDGELEILVGDDKVCLFKHKNGYFQKIDPNININCSTEKGDVNWTDYDNDGALDIIAGGYDQNNRPVTKIFRNTGTGQFSDINAGLHGIAYPKIVCGDIDNNGWTDLIISGIDYNYNCFTDIYKNINGTFYKTTHNLINVKQSSLSLGDINNDGKLDLYISGNQIKSPVANNALYINNESKVNSAPGIPANLVTTVEPNKIILAWDKSGDPETSIVTYNISLKREDGSYALSPMSLSDGTPLLPERGNTDLLSSKIVANLPKGKYIWNVQAIDNGYKASAWSDPVKFSTFPPPTLQSPGNNAVYYTGNINLIWKNNDAGTKHYIVHLSDDSSFTHFVFIDSFYTSTSKALQLPQITAKYYWKIKAVADSNENCWSKVQSFTIIYDIPPVPMLVSPVNKAPDQPLDVTFSWNGSPFSVTYKYQLSVDSMFASLIVEDSTITLTSKTVSGLVNNKMYFWRVSAKNSLGTSNFSPAYSFTTLLPPPGKPCLFQPANNSIGQPTNINLKWSSALNATAYKMQLSTDSMFTNIIMNDSALTDTAKQISCLQNNMKYYWRVQGINSNVPGVYSDVWNFKTIVAVPYAPVLISPANNAVKQPITLTLSWNTSAQAETYIVQVAGEQEFANLLISDSTLRSAEIQLAGFSDGIKYFWKVKAKNIAGNSPCSETRNFITLLFGPEKTEAFALNESKIKITWTDKSENESGFVLERKLSSGHDFKIIDTVSAGITAYIDTSLIHGTSYTYRVKAINKVSESDYGNDAVAKTATSVEELNNSVPTEYALYQNYPNPFNPATKIKYSLPVESSVKIVIYNAVGEIVRVLINDVEQAGYKEVSFDGSNHSSGMYICSMTANAIDGSKDIHTIKKIMLLK